MWPLVGRCRNDPRLGPPPLQARLARQPAPPGLLRDPRQLVERRVPLLARVRHARSVARGPAAPGVRAPPRRPVARGPARRSRRCARGAHRQRGVGKLLP